MLILQWILLLYILVYGKKLASTRYILWLDFTLWCVLLSQDMANPGGIGPHFAELVLFLITTVYYIFAHRKQEKAKQAAQEHAEMLQQLKAYEQQIENLLEQNDKVCRIKHDLKNQFLHLSSLANNGDFEQVQHILDETLERHISLQLE